MRDLLPDLDRWLAEGKQMALATVVQTWGSSPRQAGAKMAITSAGEFSGSVSGGCVENAVIEAAQEVLETRQPRLLHFGVSDETAWEVGLACGGSIEIFVQPLNTIFFRSLRDAWTDDEVSSIHVTVIRGGTDVSGRELLVREDGTVIGNPWDLQRVPQLARQAFLHATSRRAAIDAETEVFLGFISPPPTLMIVGGVHIAIALAALAKTLGYRTVVIDPRRVWANEERFPHIDRLIQAWPQEAFAQLKITRSTAVVMLTHDDKLDDPAMKIALDSPAFYIGALGSKKTHAARRERLLAAGLDESQLNRLHAPIGLDIGAQTPEEIALAIMAEVVQADRKHELAPAKMNADLHSLS